MMPSPDFGHAGVAAAERTRRVRDALAAGEVLNATDAGWFAQGLERYLTGASAGVKLEGALGVAVPPGGSPWWYEWRRAECDGLIRDLAATLSGPPWARAQVVADELRRYRSAGR